MGDGYALPYTAANQNSSLEAAMINVTSVQRNGNGAYLVKSSANNFSAGSTENTYCGRDGIYPDLTCSETILDTTHQFPYPIVVAALRADDVKSSYSTPGPSVWISGYGGEYGYNSSYVGTPSGIYDPAIMTVDQSGCTSGYVGANSSAAQAGVNINQFNDNSGGTQRMQIVITILLLMAHLLQHLL